ncbi:MAG TPA: hypothetical protein VK483_05070 [Chitinophagaceae bacterium]|nr:hypothetical protein [Chitinophagaceae bacterium]
MTDPKNKKEKDKKDPAFEPDPETLHKTDPQEHMKGPVSSVVKKVEKEVEEGNKETKEEADKKKEENM